ncbi:Uncharacterised protein [Streptococcus pneumoniae]|nr:Uncharacterised protein [Streptococcus pneumoniae]CRF30410.1 Uncharacterised protein [Streptococcus pneumoniae]
MRPFLGNKFNTVFTVTLLPHPDSPTIPKTFPLSKVKFTSLIIGNAFLSVMNSVFKFFTSKTV